MMGAIDYVTVDMTIDLTCAVIAVHSSLSSSDLPVWGWLKKRRLESTTVSQHATLM